MQQRSQRLASQIHKLSASALQEWFPGVYLTVTEVEVTDDLHQATIWISVFDDDKQQSILDEAVSLAGRLRSRIASSLNMRRVPHVQVRPDRRGQHAQEIYDGLAK